jgi:transcriptional regulator with XRE-family HTH domain
VVDEHGWFLGWIRQARQARGWTQLQLALRLGYRSEEIVRSVERGRRRVTARFALRAADAFGITQDKRERFVQAARGLAQVGEMDQ